MKPKLHTSDLFILGIIILPFIYLAYVYNRLPAMVPTHFGLDGKPNDFSRKSSMWLILALTGGISIFLVVLLRFLPNIDPKKKVKYSASAFDKIAFAVVMLLCAINFLAVNAAQSGSFKFTRTMPVLMGLFFAFMGNIMHSIKPNYFAGIRTPWTLESEDTWRLTHQFGGKLWFFGGIAIAAISLLLPENITPFFMIGGLFIIIIIPVIYSYIVFKSLKKNSQ